MPSKYRVVGLSDGYETPVGEYNDAVEMASAMWELGLTRPDFDRIRVYESVNREPKSICVTDAMSYLISKYKCSIEEARRALDECEGSVIHAAVLLERQK